MGGGAHIVHLKASLFSFMIFNMLFITILSSTEHSIMQHAQAFKNKFLPKLHTVTKKGG